MRSDYDAGDEAATRKDLNDIVSGLEAKLDAKAKNGGSGRAVALRNAKTALNTLDRIKVLKITPYVDNIINCAYEDLPIPGLKKTGPCQNKSNPELTNNGK